MGSAGRRNRLRSKPGGFDFATMTVGAVVVVLVSRPLRCGRLRHVEIGQDFPKHCLQSFFKGPGTHTTLYNAEVFTRGFPYLDLENTPSSPGHVALPFKGHHLYRLLASVSKKKVVVHGVSLDMGILNLKKYNYGVCWIFNSETFP
jgi:hypothetical protein